MQVRSLTHRNRVAEALGLGLESLSELGITIPAADRLAAELDHQLGAWYRWLDQTEAADDLAWPDLTDPKLLAASGLINATSPAAYLAGDSATTAWLGLEALPICLEHGLAPALIAPLAFTAFGAVVLRGDYAAGYRAARRILALGEARGYEPGTSNARMIFAVLSCWCEPLEISVRDRSAGQGGADCGGRPGRRRLHLLRVGASPAGLRAITGQLPRRGRDGTGLCAPHRQRTVRSGTRLLPVAGRGPAR